MTIDNHSFEDESPELLQHLLGSLRDGNLTNEQIAQLDMLLADDPKAREEYLNYVQLCADLRNHHGVAPSLPVTLPAQKKTFSRRNNYLLTKFSSLGYSGRNGLCPDVSFDLLSVSR